jgi:site-specific DNA-methyltransferase (adenine-specific)
MTVSILQGDCRDRLREMPDASVDACVTDPPYGLSFMGKKWDYDVPRAETWAEVLRVLKLGAHLLSFFGSRTYHRGVVQIEDAGFEIRDTIMWLYGSGFPKSHNLEGEWEGWGTALKPAYEPIVVARKPLIGTVAENVKAHGTGPLNIDASRIGYESTANPATNPLYRVQNGDAFSIKRNGGEVTAHAAGRWPANVIHDGSDEVLAGFPDAPGQMDKASTSETQRAGQNTYGVMKRGSNGQEPRLNSGSAARFFYCAKASKSDRDEGLEAFEKKLRASSMARVSQLEGKESTRISGTKNPRANSHPTVKPTDLMRYLCRLVTPPGGVILDPFMGSGSTGKAAVREGFDFVGCELDAEYVAIARARIDAALAEPSQEVLL